MNCTNNVTNGIQIECYEINNNDIHFICPFCEQIHSIQKKSMCIDNECDELTNALHHSLLLCMPLSIDSLLKSLKSDKDNLRVLAKQHLKYASKKKEVKKW